MNFFSILLFALAGVILWFNRKAPVGTSISNSTITGGQVNFVADASAVKAWRLKTGLLWDYRNPALHYHGDVNYDEQSGVANIIKAIQDSNIPGALVKAEGDHLYNPPIILALSFDPGKGMVNALQSVAWDEVSVPVNSVFYQWPTNNRPILTI